MRTSGSIAAAALARFAPLPAIVPVEEPLDAPARHLPGTKHRRPPAGGPAGTPSGTTSTGGPGASP